MEKYKILFVCLGNICRSPAGEEILRVKLAKKGFAEKVEIDSAGTSGYHDGDLPDNRMRKHGKKRGYAFDSLSRKLLVKDLYNFDLILAMDDSNYHNIIRLCPDKETEDKVHRMVEFSKKYKHDHIPDPYYSGADGFELVLDLLEDACDGVLDYLENKRLLDNE